MLCYDQSSQLKRCVCGFVSVFTHSVCVCMVYETVCGVHDVCVVHAVCVCRGWGGGLKGVGGYYMCLWRRMHVWFCIPIQPCVCVCKIWWVGVHVNLYVCTVMCLCEFVCLYSHVFV